MWYPLKALASVSLVEAIVLVIAPSDEWFGSFVWEIPKLQVLRVGGANRAETVRNGLDAMDCGVEDWVLVHDAARCCLTTGVVERLLVEVGDDPEGGLLGLRVQDTVKRVDSNLCVTDTVPRTGLWLAQTPQMFQYGKLRHALEVCELSDVTDEASAIERCGGKPRLVEGDVQNFKVTYPRDLALVRAVLAARKDSDVSSWTGL